MSGGVLCFRYASHSGVSSGWSSMDTGSSRGAAAAGGDKRDDGVASIGDRTGVTGALYFGANVSRKSCSQPGSEIGSSRGAAAAGGDKRDDGVASIGDRTGVTGALYFGANVSRKSCSQPGSAVTS